MKSPIYSSDLQHVIQIAKAKAGITNNAEMSPAHLLFGLTHSEGDQIEAIFQFFLVRREALREKVEICLPAHPPGRRIFVYYSEPMKRILVHAVEEARKLGDESVDTQHVLLALLREDSLESQLLMSFGLKYITVWNFWHQKRSLLRSKLPKPEWLVFMRECKHLLEEGGVTAKQLAAATQALHNPDSDFKLELLRLIKGFSP